MRKSALLLAFGLVVAIIVALGLVVLSSASGANALRIHHDPYYFMKRQFLYLGAGIAVATGAALFDYRRWREYSVLAWLFYGVVFVLLLAVFTPCGRYINGSYRWIGLGFFNLQPSELAKIATAIITAVWLDKAGWRVELFMRGAFWPMVLIGVLALPVMFEPDFGSTMVIGLTGLLVMFVAGVRVMHIAPFAGLGFILLAVKVCQNENRMKRIFAWLASSLPGCSALLSNFGIDFDLSPESLDAATKSAAWQGRMALAAIGRGGVWGVGLNQSMQKYQYLPEAHTDMIFAIGAEELGLPFSIGAFVLFLLFFALSVYIANKASDRFGRLIVVGMSFIIFFAAMFNIGVVCEALPMKGMALPFFSYGGTNMICACFAIGTILSVGIHSRRDDRKRKVPHG